MVTAVAHCAVVTYHCMVVAKMKTIAVVVAVAVATALVIARAEVAVAAVYTVATESVKIYQKMCPKSPDILVNWLKLN